MRSTMNSLGFDCVDPPTRLNETRPHFGARPILFIICLHPPDGAVENMRTAPSRHHAHATVIRCSAWLQPPALASRPGGWPTEETDRCFEEWPSHLPSRPRSLLSRRPSQPLAAVMAAGTAGPVGGAGFLGGGTAFLAGFSRDGGPPRV